MTALARLAAVLMTALLPVLALAQYGESPAAPAPAAPDAGFGWLWAVAIAAILVVLAIVMFRRARRGGPTPPARRSLGV